jgi:hypothetical protein
MLFKEIISNKLINLNILLLDFKIKLILEIKIIIKDIVAKLKKIFVNHLFNKDKVDLKHL